jgi:hypothetical protein
VADRATLISQQDRALTLPVLDLFLGDPSSHGMEQFMLIEHSLRTRIHSLESIEMTIQGDHIFHDAEPLAM